jgi:hypothetical protein
VTTLSAEAGRRITVAETTPVMERHLAEALGYRGWRHVYDPDVLARHSVSIPGELATC